jgi:hypothetical protein
MSDLSDLAGYCHVKAVDLIADPDERRLWEQIAGEIETYMSDPDDAAADLFEATS